MEELFTQSQLDSVLGRSVARKLYEDGARRWRIPHHQRRLAPSGLDIDLLGTSDER